MDEKARRARWQMEGLKDVLFFALDCFYRCRLGGGGRRSRMRGFGICHFLLALASIHTSNIPHPPLAILDTRSPKFPVNTSCKILRTIIQKADVILGRLFDNNSYQATVFSGYVRKRSFERSVHITDKENRRPIPSATSCTRRPLLDADKEGEQPHHPFHFRTPII